MVGGAGSVAVGRGLSAVFLREPVVLRLLDLVLIGLDEVVKVVGVYNPVCGVVCVSNTCVTTVALGVVVGVDVVGGRGTVVVVVVVVVCNPVCVAVCVSNTFVTTLSFTSSLWIAIVRESIVSKYVHDVKTVSLFVLFFSEKVA